jgi:predicted methyltransferase
MIRSTTLLFLVATGIWAGHARADEATNDCIRITSKDSLVHIGIYDAFEPTEGGRWAARMLMNAIEQKDPNAAKEAIDVYNKIIPKESFRSEYAALKWFCEYLMTPQQNLAKLLPDRYTQGFFDYFTTNEFAVLREYLNRRYQFKRFTDQDPSKVVEREGHLEDLLTFHNPLREAWEKTGKVVDVLGLKSGDRIADIGCGPGFYTMRFADKVGPQGRVYAIDVRQMHLDFLSGMLDKFKIGNVEPIHSRLNSICLSNQVDMAFMCSWYAIVYATSMEKVKDEFIDSIRKALKKDGTLVVVENELLRDVEPPYRSSYVARELVIAQLKYYGFRLVAQHQFIPERYVLVFRKLDEMPAVPPIQAQVCVTPENPDCLQIVSRSSLLHLGSLDSFDITEGGKRAARLILTMLEKKDSDAARAAVDVYEKIVPGENFGGEYTALRWFCELFLAGDDTRKAMLQDKMNASYYEFWAENDFMNLKEYLKRKYHLEPMNDKDPRLAKERATLLEDFILFNNPRREGWEKTSKMMEILPLKRGSAVADIGCGPGYYTFKFADLVGPEGKVYALDINDKHVEYVAGLAKKYGVANIEPIISQPNSICVSNPVDLAFMCSLYHIVYAASTESVRSAFIDSIKKVLKDDGTLVIADNALVENTQLPYHGPYIAKELIIAQMKHYGFRLTGSHQFIPQRYVLLFKKETAAGRAR